MCEKKKCTQLWEISTHDVAAAAIFFHLCEQSVYRAYQRYLTKCVPSVPALSDKVCTERTSAIGQIVYQTYRRYQSNCVADVVAISNIMCTERTGAIGQSVYQVY